MPRYNIEKLNEFKNLHKITLKELSRITEIPCSSLSKVFSGFNKSPQIDVLLKIADAFSCSLDDFIDYEKEPESPYYYDRQIGKIAQDIYNSSCLKKLFSICRNLPKEDLQAVIAVSERLSILH